MAKGFCRPLKPYRPMECPFHAKTPYLASYKSLSGEDNPLYSQASCQPIVFFEQLGDVRCRWPYPTWSPCWPCPSQPMAAFPWRRAPRCFWWTAKWCTSWSCGARWQAAKCFDPFWVLFLSFFAVVFFVVFGCFFGCFCVLIRFGLFFRKNFVCGLFLFFS